MINPHAGAVADGDAVVIENLSDLQVLNNDIVAIVDVQSLAGDVGRKTNTDERSVGSDGKTSGQNDLALELDNLGCIALDGLDKLLSSRNSHGFATLATSGDANGVVLCVTLDTPSSNLEVIRRESDGEGRKDAANGRRQLHLGSRNKDEREDEDERCQWLKVPSLLMVI